jgi:lipopolysaccharide export system permease protein
MKKIDKLLLGAFVGPFFMTFLVVVFILLTQHMLKYFDDIIGKGLDADVIGRLLFYFAIFMTPVALPLAVLLSSLIAFGNLGEHFELTAIKSSGISLVRTLRPIFFFVLLLTVGAFWANNNLVPKAALEAYSLLYDIKQKKPALDLREGAFYSGINDISIKVNKKFDDGITIKDVVVYDHRKNDGNKEVTVADSGKMYTILNDRYLKFELFNGYNYSEGSSMQKDVSVKRKSRTESLSRSKFAKSQIVFDLSDLALKPTDKKWFQGNRIMRNIAELNSDMDSINREILTQRLNYYQFRPSYFHYLDKSDTVDLPPYLREHQKYQDSLLRHRFAKPYHPAIPSSGSTTPTETAVTVKPEPDSLPANHEAIVDTMPAAPEPAKVEITRQGTLRKARELKARSEQLAARPMPKFYSKKKSATTNTSKDSTRTMAAKPVNKDSLLAAKVDSLFHLPPSFDNYQGATNAARQIKTNIQNTNASEESYSKEMINFEIQWHKILASSLACVAMFLIGAPLGAIIKKGGLGMPFLVSIIFFIIYYVITMQGEKLAKQGAVSPAFGVWMADVILFIIGLIFLRQARADARLFEADFYNVVFDKAKRWFESRRRAVQTSAAR